jgi:hypothetical protein
MSNSGGACRTQKAAYPGFAEHERKTTRQIPVVVLESTP